MGSTEPTPPGPRHINFLVIGAGSRGTAYARAITHLTATTDSVARIAAIAEPDAFKREEFGRTFIWSDAGKPAHGQAFNGWEQWLEWETARRSGRAGESAPSGYEPIAAALVCTLDATHHPIVTALAPFGLHILCEKPLALSLSDCLSISHSLQQIQPRKICSIGHVLRYSPHNILLHRLACEDLAVGSIVSVEHTEPVGWWHFSHSYVRGNWRRETPEGIGSLLTKSCHDIDFLMWMLASPNTLTGHKVHEPATIYSTGALTHFKKSRKPAAADNATNCLSCPLQDEGCQFSAKRIYTGDRYRKKTGWPVSIVAPEIESIQLSQGNEAARKHLLGKLSEDYTSDSSSEKIGSRSWYGRCVYESDNNVMDEQTVIISWKEDQTHQSHPDQGEPTSANFSGRGPKSAIFHMTYPTQAQCERRGRIYGTVGELSYDSDSITLYTFATGKTQIFRPNKDVEVGEGHGGGDFGLAGNFVKAVEAVERGGMEVAQAQMKFVGCDMDEIVRSHAVVMAAEESRQTGRVVQWDSWWDSKRKGTNP